MDAKPLGSALIDLAVQANVSIATPKGGFGDKRAAPVRGAYEPEVALRMLLEGSEYAFERIDAVTFRIVLSEEVIPPPAVTVLASDIVVTAAYRPRTLDRLPGSATVLDETSIERAGMQETADFAFDAAGLTLTNLGPGRNKLSIRGLSDGGYSGRTRSMLGIYIDDTRVSHAAPDPDLQFVDIEKVELLRGPQGTLFGAGAISGIYQVVTRRADPERQSGSLALSTDVRQGGDQGTNIEGVLNLPIEVGRSAVRFVGYRQALGGWLDNASLNLTNTNATLRQGGRIEAASRIGDTWTATARGVYQSIEADDSQYVDSMLGRAARSNSVMEPHSAEIGVLSVTTQGRFAGGELTTITSYLRQRLVNRYNATGGFVFLGVPRGRVSAYDDRMSIETAAAEVRYAAVASPFPWNVGMYFARHGRFSHGGITDNPDDPTAIANEYDSARQDWTGEAAIFGGANFTLLPDVELSVAARFAWFDQSTRASAQGLQSDDFVGQHDESNFSPKVELSYAPNPGAFYYLNAARGFRYGGFNTGAASIFTSGGQPARQYGRDDLWSFETGAKNALFNSHLRLRAALFWQIWRNIQTDQLFAAGVPFTGNVGDGETKGVELEATAHVSEALEVRVNASYTDSEITRVDAAFPARLNSSLPGAPPISAGVSVLYDRPIATDLNLTGSLRAMYVGRSNIAFQRQTELQIGDYTVTSVRLGLERKENWRASLYVNNLFNTWSSTYSYGNPIRFGGAGMLTPLRPRLFGMQLEKSF